MTKSCPKVVSGSLATVIAVGGYLTLVKAGVGVPPDAVYWPGVFLAVSIGAACFALLVAPREVARQTALVVFRVVYGFRIRGAENIPEEGGVLLIGNHVSYLDPLLVAAASRRPVRFLGFNGFEKHWLMKHVFRVCGVIPVSPTRAKDAVIKASAALQAGEVVCLFPEGAISRTGILMGLQRGFSIIARRGGATVVPLALDSVYGSIFSFYDNSYFWKLPRFGRVRAAIQFGTPMTSDEATPERARESIVDLAHEAYEERPPLRGHLADAAFRALARTPRKLIIVDRTAGRRELSRGKLLAAATVLSRRWKKTIAERRVGIVLPPGIGGLIANLAIVLAGKIPVNLNFTSGRASVEACFRKAEIETVVSAQAMREKLPEFPWPENTLDLTEELKSLGKPKIVTILLAAMILPAGLLSRLLGLPREGDREEAAILFSSGSTGDPKGVILTHRNLIGNCMQVNDIGLLDAREKLLASLPIFHSFGFTITIWFPILHGIPIITVPSPLDTKGITKAIKAEQATILLGTPTFFRPYFKRTKPEDLASLKYVVAGAEKTPSGFGERWQEHFNCGYLEGYGLTETSPVAAVNLPNPACTTSTATPQPASRTNSAGRLIQGMAARVVSPDTGTPLPLGETGMLQLKGPNIFPGYLNDPVRTGEVFQDGWFVSGDLGRFDEDGFLFIEGRLSRFSKIGGEMVPHGAVEQHVVEAFGFENADAPQVAIAGVADEARGEALVLLTVVPITREELREKLTAAGLPNLWIPKKISQIEKIPCLPTGKLDLRGLSDAATQA